MMNTQDMQRLGIAQNASVDVVSGHGEMSAFKAYAFDFPPGNVMAYYPKANILIGLERDPRIQTPRLNQCQ